MKTFDILGNMGELIWDSYLKCWENDESEALLRKYGEAKTNAFNSLGNMGQLIWDSDTFKVMHQVSVESMQITLFC